MTNAYRQPASASSVEPKGRAAEAAVDNTVDYSDEVTTEQMARIDRAYAHIDKTKLRSKTGRAW